MRREEKNKHEGWMLPLGERLAYIFGTGATQSFNTFVSMFLAAYLLMIGVDPKISAVVVLFVKIWDAANDAIFGFMVDKIRFKDGKNKFTKWLFSGRYMPWFRTFFWILPVGMIMMFSASTDAPVVMRVAQYAIGYFIFDTGLTIASAYSLVPLSLTDNLEERNYIIAWGGLGQCVGLIPPMILGSIFVTANVGYSGAAVIFSVIGLIIFLLPAMKLKERNVVSIAPEKREKYTIKDAFATFRIAPEALMLCLGAFLCIILATDGGYSMFVCYYLFGNAKLSVMLGVISLIPTFVVVPFLPEIFKRLDKGTMLTLVCAITAATSFLIYFLGVDFLKTHIVVYCMLYALRSTTTVLFSFGCTMSIPDLAEVAKYRTGRDCGGIISAAHSFSYKLAQGIVGSLSLTLLAFFGWAAVEAKSFDELASLNAQGIGLQTSQALSGLWIVSTLIPAFGYALGAAAFFFMKLNNKNVRIYMKCNGGEITREEAENQLQKI